MNSYDVVYHISDAQYTLINKYIVNTVDFLLHSALDVAQRRNMLNIMFNLADFVVQNNHSHTVYVYDIYRIKNSIDYVAAQVYELTDDENLRRQISKHRCTLNKLMEQVRYFRA